MYQCLMYSSAVLSLRGAPSAFLRANQTRTACSKALYMPGQRSRLRSIIEAKATHLLTVDKKHFGSLVR